MSLKQTKILDTCTDINEFKKSYQHKSNLVQDVNGDWLADSHCIFNRGKNCLCQMLNVYGVNDVMRLKYLQLSH
jgi:hypothetical protein